MAFPKNCAAFICGSVLHWSLLTIGASAAPEDDLSPKEDYFLWIGDRLHSIEQREKGIRSTIDRLAQRSTAAGVGSVGTESRLHSHPKNTEWVQVAWEKPVPIDQVVLVPMLFLTNQGYTATGFPREIRVVAGTPENPEGVAIAALSKESSLLPRSTPLVIPCQTTASWVRVEAHMLSKRFTNDAYAFQLSELLVFSGEENVALQGKVTTSSIGNQEGQQRNRSALVDGYLPYVMNAPGPKTGGLAFTQQADVECALTIDLGSPSPISQVRIHPQESTTSAPGGVNNDYGMPAEFVLKGANNADFSDAVVLANRKKKSYTDSGTILMLRFPETTCRYVRLSPKVLGRHSLISLSEIEVLSKGRNVAAGKPVHLTGVADMKRPQSITDGSNIFGRILPLKQWMNELARRHDLETELPLLRQQMRELNEQQRVRLRVAIGIATLVVVGGAFTLLTFQLLKMRQIANLRARFAADLHDELGANLGSIGLLAEMAREDLHDPEKLEHTIEEINILVDHTRSAARHCIDKQMHPMQANLAQDLQTLSARMLADMDWDLQLTGDEFLQRLKPTVSDDLLLFFKECLVNVSRHSEATRVQARLQADQRILTLQVEDNGIGLHGGTPKSLLRRAKLLGGKTTSAKAALGGTQITLTLRMPRARFFPRITKAKKNTP